MIAARRLERTVARLKQQGAGGVMAYSEGVFDDVNKAILAGLASGRFHTADEVLRAYARRYFKVDEETAARWARWLAAWGNPFAVDTRRSGEELAALLAKTPEDNWRRRQWELKQQLFEIHGQIGPGDTWTPERLELVEQFWAVQEKLQRGVWGLAPQRHVFARRYTPLPWYPSWAKHVAAE